MNKTYARVLILTLTATSLLFISIVQAAIPKPSVPEFSLKIVQSPPYDIPPTTTIDPYTGETIITEPGHHAVQNQSIELTIKNQPFTPYTDENGNITNLYYSVSFKGHFEDTWKIFGFERIVNATNSEYTITQIPFNSYKDSQVDIRVLAQIGYYTRSMREGLASFPLPTYDYYFIGESSDWSDTQTIKVPARVVSSTPTPNTSPTPLPSDNSTGSADQSGSQNATSSNWDYAQIAALTLSALVAVSLLVYFKKRKRSVSPFSTTSNKA